VEELPPFLSGNIHDLELVPAVPLSDVDDYSMAAVEMEEEMGKGLVPMDIATRILHVSCFVCQDEIVSVVVEFLITKL